MKNMRLSSKERMRWTSGIAAGLSIMLVGCGQPSPSESGEAAPVEYEWRFVSYLPENTSAGKVAQWWMDEVEARSDGRITFDPHFGATLLPPDEIFTALEDGRVDVGLGIHNYTGEPFPFTEVATLPFQTSNRAAADVALRDMYAEYPEFQDEWASRGLHPLAFISSSPHMTASTEALQDPSGFEGMDVRAVGTPAAVIADSGANVVALPVAEVYEGLQRGLIQAVATTAFDVAGSLRLFEHAKYFVDDGIGIYGMQELLMAEEQWNELPDDLRDVVSEVNLELTEQALLVYGETDDATCDLVREDEVDLVVWSDEVVEDWRARTEAPVLEKWAASVGDATLADEYLASYRDAVEKYELADPGIVSGLEKCAVGTD